MEQLVIFAIKHLICTALLWGCYRVFISKNTFHQTNRVVILLILVVALVLPWIEIPILDTRFLNEDFSNTVLLQPLANTPTLTTRTSSSFGLYEMVSTAYFLVTLWLFIRYLVGLVSVVNIIRRARKVVLYENITTYVTTRKVSPFSWFGYIVLSKKDFESSPRNVLLHERAHVKQGHSWDMLLSHLYCIVFWWNPWAWLLKNALETTHEFQADAIALKQVANPNEYRKELITRGVGNQKMALVHCFETRNLKTRIYMTMKKPSSARAKWSYATLVLVATAILCLFSNETLQAQAPQPQDSLSGKVSDVKIIKINPFTIKDSSSKHPTPNPLVIIDGKEEAYLQLSNLSPENIKSISVLKDKQAIKVYGEKGKHGVLIINTKGEKASAPENKQNIPTYHATITYFDETLVIMDGKVISRKELEAFDPNKIASIEVLKDQKSLEKYNAKGKKSIILVTTKK